MLKFPPDCSCGDAGYGTKVICEGDATFLKGSMDVGEVICDGYFFTAWH